MTNQWNNTWGWTETLQDIAILPCYDTARHQLHHVVSLYLNTVTSESSAGFYRICQTKKLSHFFYSSNNISLLPHLFHDFNTFYSKNLFNYIVTFSSTWPYRVNICPRWIIVLPIASLFTKIMNEVCVWYTIHHD